VKQRCIAQRLAAVQEGLQARAPGRPKGSTNVMTRMLKEAILLAGENVGNAARREQTGPHRRKDFNVWIGV
jgi:hypothetical protein